MCPRPTTAWWRVAAPAGAIVTCKTNVPDMGAGANTRNAVWGATGNPFDPRLNAGGSSGGSAAALATGMLPLCTGSDTGGSLRIPAALCGVVGLRPSRGWWATAAARWAGRRSRCWGRWAARWPTRRCCWPPASAWTARRAVVPGPLGRLLAAARGGPVPLRIGFTEDFGFCAVDPEIRRVLRQRVAALAPHVASVRATDSPT
jgi:amidase